MTNVSQSAPRTQGQAGIMSPARGFEISDWKAFSKNTLRGFFSVTLPSGLVLHACSYHEKNDARWVAMPAQKFVKDDGTTSYTPIIEFTSDDARKRFQAAAITAIDAHLGGRQ